MKEWIKKRYTDINDGILAYKFAIYAVATNRLYLKELEGSDKIKDFPFGYTQFIVIDYNSEANMKFERLKKKVRFTVYSSIKLSSCFMVVLRRIGIVF